MSGTVDYPKVIDHLTDVIKELNVGFAPCGAAAPSKETRRADAVRLLKALLSTLEQGNPSAGAAAAAAAAEHDATADKGWGNWNFDFDSDNLEALGIFLGVAEPYRPMSRA